MRASKEAIVAAKLARDAPFLSNAQKNWHFPTNVTGARHNDLQMTMLRQADDRNGCIKAL
jgi:hypothetical protein